MLPTIRTIAEKKLIGKRIVMNFIDNKTAELWRSFMPRRKELTNKLTNELISMEVYNESYSFTAFDPHKTFEKWAAVEVTDFDTLPDGMESFVLKGGLYAVFQYKGLNTDTAIYQYIFGTWLPGSDYILDNRPHFEVLGEKYKNNDPDSEEDIWIPIKAK